MSHHLQISHNESQNAPNKQYLEPHLNITAMWENYKSTHRDISYIVYQRAFQSENIGFGKPLQDKWDVCSKYRTHCKDLDGAHDVDACEQCKIGQDHKKKAEEAHTHYCEDRDKVTLLRIESNSEKIHAQ